jgi:pimeloyl-ACP methyl ester carboxylesterase
LISPWKGLEWLGPDVKIARGFQEAWDDSAQQVLDQVRLAKDRYPDARITTTGHSLGGAIALLGALHLSHFLSADVKVVVFGMPRVGNREVCLALDRFFTFIALTFPSSATSIKFANAVDQYLPDQNHIVNYKDPVPHMPAMILGFRHPLGEIWIANEQGDLVYQCPGYENEHCSDSVSGYDLLNHSGPYFGQNVECTAKPPA